MKHYVKINTGLLRLPLVVIYLLTEKSRVKFQLIGQDTFTSFLSIRVFDAPKSMQIYFTILFFKCHYNLPTCRPTTCVNTIDRFK